MAVEWTITIEGKNEFGDVCRKAVRIDKSWERLFDGGIGLSIEDGKTIMTALQSAVAAHEAETYSVFRRVCPDCHTFRPVKDYTSRRIRTVFGTVEVRNPRWMLCRDCHPGMDGAFAPLKEIYPDRATPELLELSAPSLRAVYLSETVEDYRVANGTGSTVDMDGFTEEQIRVSTGAVLSRRYTLDGGTTMTPKLGINTGFAGVDGEGLFGNVTAGIEIGTEFNWDLDLTLLYGH